MDARQPRQAQALWVQALLFLARYEKDHLELETRRRIYELLQEYPGLHLSEIARRTGLETNHAKYHLEYLETHDLASSRKEAGYWRFFPKVEGELGSQEVLDRKDKALLAVLRKEIPLHVTLLLLEMEYGTHTELVEEVGVSGSTLHYHLSKMEDEGLLVSEKEGRVRTYWIEEPERVVRLLVEHRPPDELVRGFLEAWEELGL